jgi:hypothetical protein
MKATSLTTVFTKSIPAAPEPETLYVSMDYRTAVHLCACGCGTKVITPLGSHDWVLTFDGTVTLRPSVGNGQQPCRSHYYIRHNCIEWLPRISAAATSVALERDRAAQSEPIDAQVVRMPWWRRVWNWARPTS